MAVAGLEKTHYQATEYNIGNIEICVTVMQSSVKCPSFAVNLTAIDGTAGM